MINNNPAYNYRFGDDHTWPDLTQGERWYLVVYPVGGPVMSLRDECMQAAIMFSRRAQAQCQDMLLHLSGGDDSTAMVHCFMHQDLPFKCHTRVHRICGKTANEEDVQTAQDFCAHHGITLNVQVIEDVDKLWGTTEERYFLDMTALTARLGYRANADKFNLQATAPYLMTGRDTWDLLPTFSLGPLFLNSFFFGSRGVFFALLAHRAMEISEPALRTLKKTADQLPGHHRELLHDVFTYESIVKPMVMHDAFPELRLRARVKNTGFDQADPAMNHQTTPWNAIYHELLRKKIFRVPVLDVLEAMRNDTPTEFWKDAQGVVQRRRQF